MSHALISLGANLGDRKRSLEGAVRALDATSQIRVSSVSRWHETHPVGGPPNQDEFLNGAAVLETDLSPRMLLQKLQEIEEQFGRQREVRWDARTLDLDLLLFDQDKILSPDLVVPHPRLAFRRFVLEAAAEIAADWRLPDREWTIAELLDHLDRRPRYVAIAGSAGSKKTFLAKKIAAKCHGVAILQDDEFSFSSFDEALAELNRRCTLLRESAFDLQRTTVSDFWLDQILYSAREHLTDRDARRLADLHERKRHNLASPTLLIVLEENESRASESIKGHAHETNLPAVLLLDANDWPLVQSESIAAVLAM